MTPTCRFCGRPRKPRTSCLVCFPRNNDVAVKKRGTPSILFDNKKEMTQ